MYACEMWEGLKSEIGICAHWSKVTPTSLQEMGDVAYGCVWEGALAPTTLKLFYQGLDPLLPHVAQSKRLRGRTAFQGPAYPISHPTSFLMQTCAWGIRGVEEGEVGLGARAEGGGEGRL